MPAREAGAPAWTRLQGPNLWPAALPELRSDLLAWQEAVTQVGIRLLEAFALALGQPADAFAPIYAGAPNQHIKIIRYPGRASMPDEQGVGAHKDSGFLTLPVQDGEGGLEVADDSGGWIAAAPVPGAFVADVGELLELASNGYLRATIHRGDAVGRARPALGRLHPRRPSRRHRAAPGPIFEDPILLTAIAAIALNALLGVS